MGRYITCGIATCIDIRSKVSVQENKEAILKRIGSVFNLKYYDINYGSDDDFIHLYLKEDLVNEKLKELLIELVDLKWFRIELYNNINALDQKFCDIKTKKIRLLKYLNNNFDLKIRKEGNNYFMDGVEYPKDETIIFGDNYFYGTNMSDDALFDDNLGDIYNLFKVDYNCLSLYFDIGKTNSENICLTLYFLNTLLRKALKSELKDTLLFGITG